jgi:hypothetical protein
MAPDASGAGGGSRARRVALNTTRIQQDIDRYAQTMAKELKNLRWAIDEFAPGFDAGAWREAFDGADPRLAAKRSAVLFPFGNAFNCWNEIASCAHWISQGEPQPDAPMPEVYKGLAAAGALPAATAGRLRALNRHARNALTTATRGPMPPRFATRSSTFAPSRRP